MNTTCTGTRHHAVGLVLVTHTPATCTTACHIFCLGLPTPVPFVSTTTTHLSSPDFPFPSRFTYRLCPFVGWSLPTTCQTTSFLPAYLQDRAFLRFGWCHTFPTVLLPTTFPLFPPHLVPNSYQMHCLPPLGELASFYTFHLISVYCSPFFLHTLPLFQKKDVQSHISTMGLPPPPPPTSSYYSHSLFYPGQDWMPLLRSLHLVPTFLLPPHTPLHIV